MAWPEFLQSRDSLKNKFDYVVNLNGSSIFGTGLLPSNFGKRERETAKATRIGRAQELQEFVVKDERVQRFVQLSNVTGYSAFSFENVSKIMLC